MFLLALAQSSRSASVSSFCSSASRDLQPLFSPANTSALRQKIGLVFGSGTSPVSAYQLCRIVRLSPASLRIPLLCCGSRRPAAPSGRRRCRRCFASELAFALSSARPRALPCRLTRLHLVASILIGRDWRCAFPASRALNLRNRFSALRGRRRSSSTCEQEHAWRSQSATSGVSSSTCRLAFSTASCARFRSSKWPISAVMRGATSKGSSMWLRTKSVRFPTDFIETV